MQPNILGIAGPSCSGKSTVADLVAAGTGAEVFHLDAYWIRGCVKPTVNGEPSFERPEQYGGDAMARDIGAFAAAHPGHPVIAEGFLALSYPSLRALCGTMVFLRLDAATMAARRQARATAGRDASGLVRDGRADASWEANGPDEWRRWGAPQEALPGVVSVDGGLDPGVAAVVVQALWWQDRLAAASPLAAAGCG